MVVDAISRKAALAMFEELRARNLKPLSVVQPQSFAETVMRMPDAHGATRPFSFNYAPYQLEPYLEIFNPRNQEVAMMMFSRGGKSRIVLTALGFIIVEQPCRIGVMWPVEGDGKLWSKDDFMGELVEPTPEIAALIDEATGRRQSKNTLLHKQFTGGHMQILGANAPGRLRRMKARVLYADEIDAIVEIRTDEGDQLKIFAKRGSEFPDCIQVYCSYPSVKGKSRIETKLLESDYRRWFVTCVLCGGEPYVMHPDQLRYEDGPEHARLECPRCKRRLDDRQRRAMMMGGDPEKPRFDLWRPTLPFRGKAGFHANSTLWPHPVDPIKYPGGYLQVLATKLIEIESSENPERARRVLINTDYAETYESASDVKPEHSALFQRREKYSPSTMLPAGVLWIAFACDVQGSALNPKTETEKGGRLELEIIGFGERGHTWGLGYYIINGTPMAPPNQGVWAELDRIITTTTFPHPSGKTLRISGGLIDRGYKPDNVLAFTRPRARMGIFASRGATSLSKPIIRAKPGYEGNPKTKVWELGTHEAKDVIYQRLERDNRAADGFMHFPEHGSYSETYFKMLVAEDSDLQKAGDGKFYRHFSCDQGVRNEALDIRVMALAIERIRKPKYSQLAIELAMPDPAAKSAATGQSAPKVAAETQKKTPQNRPFVNRNRPAGGGGFVQGWRR